MARGTAPRHARPSGRSETAAAYQAALSELVAVRSARWTDQLEVVRLTALTEQLSTQVAALQTDLASTVGELAALRAQPPRTVEVPVVITVPAVPEPQATPPTTAPVPPAVPATSTAPAPSTAREDLLLLEMAEMRRMVATQQQLLADLTVRLLDLLARFLPPAPAGAPSAGTQGSGPVPPADPVLDDETATRLRVIREAFGR